MLATITASGRLWRDLRWYGMVGVVQLALDALAFVLLSAAGLSVAAANLLARLAGASLGFIGHGRLTFGVPGNPPLAGRPLRRFVLMWITLTLVGTVAVSVVASRGGLTLAWWIKPVVDLLLAFAQFFVCRSWVYR